jgi:hypothetical protein
VKRTNKGKQIQTLHPHPGKKNKRIALENNTLEVNFLRHTKI